MSVLFYLFELNWSIVVQVGRFWKLIGRKSALKSFGRNFANKFLQMHNEKWQTGDDNVKKAVTYKCFSFRSRFIFLEYTFEQKCLLKLCAFTWNILLSRFIVHYYCARFISNLSTRIIYREKFHTFFGEFYFSAADEKVQFWNWVLFQCQARVTFGVN